MLCPAEDSGQNLLIHWSPLVSEHSGVTMVIAGAIWLWLNLFCFCHMHQIVAVKCDPFQEMRRMSQVTTSQESH